MQDPEDERQTDTPEGPEKDPQSADVTGDKDPSDEGRGRAEGRQNPLVHEGAAPDGAPDTNESADAKAHIVEPDGTPSPEAEA
jgi:hypothetical protein